MVQLPMFPAQNTKLRQQSFSPKNCVPLLHGCPKTLNHTDTWFMLHSVLHDQPVLKNSESRIVNNFNKYHQK